MANPKIGRPPGTAQYTGKQSEVSSTITLTHFGNGEVSTLPCSRLTDIPTLVEEGNKWLCIQGFNNEHFMVCASTVIGISPMMIEDITNVVSRPKSEITPDGRILACLDVFDIEENCSGESCLHQHRVSIFIKEGIVITMEDDPEADSFRSIKERIVQPKSRTASGNWYRMAYVMFDLAVDSYYLALDYYEGQLLDLEIQILSGEHDSLNEIYSISKKLTDIITDFRAIEALPKHLIGLSNLQSEESEWIQDLTDHVDHVTSHLAKLKEWTRDLVQAKLAIDGSRANEVMKLLAIISAIFLPASFVTSWYGINFHDAATAYQEPWHWIIAIFIAIVMTATMIGMFHRGWIRPKRKRK